LRILPGYSFSLFVLVLFVQRQYLRPDHWAQLFLFLTFFMDSSKATFQQINVPFWTLAIEGQFYLFLPLIAYALRAVVRLTTRTARGRLIGAILACMGLILAGLMIRLVGLHFLQGKTDVSTQLTVARFLFFGMQGKFGEDFALGMLVSLCFTYAQHPEYGQFLQHCLKKITPFLGLSAVTVLTLCALWNFRASYPVAQLNFLLPLIPYTSWLLGFVVSFGWALLIMTLLFGNPLLNNLFEWKAMRGVGAISYAIYLWHFPLLTVFKKYIFPPLSVPTVALSYLLYWCFFALVVIPWCILVYRLIERPFIRMRGRNKFAGSLKKQKASVTYDNSSLYRDAQPIYDHEYEGLTNSQSSMYHLNRCSDDEVIKKCPMDRT
jgi:peptidoglycan/LPS O-acetylase OafA/YrhL